MRRLFTLTLLVLTPVPGLCAALRPGTWFSDGAVLQCDKPVPVWGHANPGERITVRFRDQQVGTTADAKDGAWVVLLGPFPAGTAEGELSITGDSAPETPVILRRIVVGEVWLFAGQGNLLRTIAHSGGILPAGAATPVPLLRCATLRAGTDTGDVRLAWQGASAETAGEFSAIAYHFARRLMRKTGVPVGVVVIGDETAPIEAWLSPAAMTSQNLYSMLDERWEANKADHARRLALYQSAMNDWLSAHQRAQSRGSKDQRFFLLRNARPEEPRLHAPGSCHQGLLSPLLPCSVRGMVWHHGEANIARADEYGPLLRSFIQTTRRHLGDEASPLIIVQAANIGAPDTTTPGSWGRLREAQASALSLPDTALVVTLDLGVPPTPWPADRAEIGRRIAQVALARVHGTDAEYIGPEVEAYATEGAWVRLDFAHADTGLIARDHAVQAFEIAGEDGVFHPASAQLLSASILLHSPLVARPTQVRYAWSNAAIANLANGWGLPAAPFRLTLRSPKMQAP